MAEIVDFGLQQHKIKMDSRYFENVLSVVAGDTGRRIEVQLLDTNGMVQDTTGLNLRLNAVIAGKATFTDATLVDAATGKYQLDLSNGMFLAPGNWQFQWQITDSAGKKLHSFAFAGNVGKNISEGGSQATNFYLNIDSLKAMQDDLVNGTFNSEALETNIARKLEALEETYAPRLTEVTTQLAEITHNAVYFGLKQGKENATSNVTVLQELIDIIHEKGGGEIKIPKGAYYFDSKLQWKSKVSLIGDGIDQTILRSYSTRLAEGWPLMESLNKATDPIMNCYFRDFTIDGLEQMTTVTTFAKGMYFQNVQQCVFRDIKFIGTGSTALGIDYLSDCTIDSLIMENCGRMFPAWKAGCAGIGIGTGYLPLENLTIVNCKVHNCGNYGIFVEDQERYELANTGHQPRGIIISNNVVTGGKNHGVGVRGGDDILVSNNVIYENLGSGIYVDTGSNRISIQNNNSVGNGKDGLLVIAGGMTDFMISNNTFLGNGENGISLGKVLEGSTGYEIRGMNVKGNTIKDNSKNGLEIFDTTKATVNLFVEGNTIILNGANGVKLSGNIFDLDIANNQIYDNGTELVAGDRNGILVTGNLTYSKIKRNSLHSRGTTSQENGIVLFNSVEKTLTNSIIADNDLIKHSKSNGNSNFKLIDSIVDFKDSIKETASAGRVKLSGGHVVLPNDLKILGGVPTTFVLSFEANTLKDSTILSQRQSDTLRYGRGFAIKLTPEGKLKLEWNTTSSASVEGTVIFPDYTIQTGQIYDIKVVVTSTGLDVFVIHNGIETKLITSTDLVPLKTIMTTLDLSSAVLIGAEHYDSIIGRKLDGYVYRFHQLGLAYNYLFSNIGSAEIIDSGGGYNGYCRDGAKQEFLS